MSHGKLDLAHVGPKRTAHLRHTSMCAESEDIARRKDAVSHPEHSWWLIP